MANTNGQRSGHGASCGYSAYLSAITPRNTEHAQEPAQPGSGNDQGPMKFTVIINNGQVAVGTSADSPATGRVAELPDGSSGDDEREDTGAYGRNSFRKPRQPRRRSTGGSTKHAGAERRRRHETRDSHRDGTHGGSKDMFLKVTEHVDDYASEAEMSGLDDYYRPEDRGPKRSSSRDSEGGPASRSRRSNGRSQPNDSDSDCSDGDFCATRRAEVYDSDLESVVSDVGKAAHAKKMRRFKALARDKFEKMLLECIVNTENIRDNYEDMFVDQRTIDKLEHVTRMSLLRPMAFGRGVLAGNKVTGAVLYGPPGTGKSLLAKGLARKSGFNMILASTAELWQKCHGDDEKVIKALFSMARKLHPTIVFIDEADALLGNRKAGEKRHIRAMLNQFLMEWDGLNSGKDSPFILLATNRPFDLDPAVLRRAPVRIHLDIPTTAQRFGILGLLLKEETLGPDVSIERLAKMTPRYTGSDLKNLCVTAATECVSEQDDDTPDRVLRLRHFQTAMATIKATGLSRTVESEFKNFEKGAKQGSQRQEED